MTLYIDLKPYLQWAIGEDDIPDVATTEYGKYIMYKYNGKITLRFENEKFRIVRMGSFAESEIDKARGIAQADYERRTAERFKPITLDAIAKATETQP